MLIITPGIIMAMAGVGVGDLATASLVGSRLGAGVLWAVVVGAFMKFFITEGCVRWQLKTGTTILEGCMTNLGLWFKVPFIIYFVLWSYFVSGALISASGIAAEAIYPLFGNHSKVAFGIIQSIIAGILILKGGFKLFAKIMSATAVLLFITVLISVFQLDIDFTQLTKFYVPSAKDASTENIEWLIALIGGVGGTLTVICYGYWIKESNRTSLADLKTCRIDLGVGYLLTAIFGMAMVVIVSQVDFRDVKGFNILFDISNILQTQSGRWAALCFLIGAWGAVFSSMMGVWQSAPYILLDFITGGKAQINGAHKNKYYRLWLAFIVFVPMISLFVKFGTIQKLYSYFGALVVPFLTILLLILGRKKFLDDCRNKPLTIIVGVLILLFFAITTFGLGIIPS